MSQSINLRINVLLGDQVGPVRASVIRDQYPGKVELHFAKWAQGIFLSNEKMQCITFYVSEIPFESDRSKKK